MQTEDIQKEYTDAVRVNGKLLAIQEFSNWLLDQPELIDKTTITNKLMSMVEEIE